MLVLLGFIFSLFYRGVALRTEDLRGDARNCLRGGTGTPIFRGNPEFKELVLISAGVVRRV